MEEIFEIVKAVNRLVDKVLELSSKIDFLSKSPSQQLSAKFVDEAAACKILHVRPRVLAQMRANKEIPYIKNHRKILYLASDLQEYLESNCKRF
jgi:hypothetical protein